MNNRGKSGKTVKKSPRPSHNGRPVSVKGTSSGKNISGISDRAGRRKKSSRKKKPQNILKHIVLAVVIVIVVLAVCALGYGFFEMWMEQSGLETEQQSWSQESSDGGGQEQWQAEGAPYIDVELLTPNPYSRPQIPVEQVNYIAIHYTANPGSTAMSNRNYFENLATTQENKVSSHFVVGLDGEVVQCIPTSEMSYATNARNVDTISIECCHPDETGQFNDETYNSAVKLTAWLCTRFGLNSDQVIRHYDVTGKDCPKYYVENPDAWFQMKSDIAAQIQMDYELQGK
mgnify:FL=1